MKKTLLILISLFVYSTTSFAGGMILSDPWIKSKKGIMTGAFVNITNTTGKDDKLISVESDLAKKTEIHLSFIDRNGVAKMEKQSHIDIPNDKTIKLKRGSYHIMLMGIKQKIEPNKTYKIKLFFEKSGEVEVNFIAKRKM